MGSMTYADFDDEIRLAVGGIQDTSPVLTPARMKRWLNQMYRWITLPHLYEHPELGTVEYVDLDSTNNTYATTQVYRKVVSVALVDSTDASPGPTANRHALSPIDTQAIDDRCVPVGRPDQFTYWNRQFVLDAVPDSNWATKKLQIRGFYEPSEFQGSGSPTQTTVLSADWDPVLVEGTRMLTHLRLGDADKAEFAREDFGRLFNETAGMDIISKDIWHMRPDGGPQESF